MGITKMSKVGFKSTSYLKSDSFLVGNAAFSPGSYESIATVSVGSGGQASATFTSIPATYTHLQIRGIAQDNRATYNTTAFYMNLNGDTSSNYSYHYVSSVWTVGSTALQTDGVASSTAIEWLGSIVSSVSADTFGSFVIDILEYKNTSIYKTVRALSGGDANAGAGGYRPIPRFASGNWRNTNAITSITLTPSFGTLFSQYSQFALYGIKG